MPTGFIVALSVALTILALGALASGLYTYRYGQARRGELANLANELCRELSALRISLTGLANTPAYVEGLGNLAKDQIAATLALKEAVAKFHESLFGRENQSRQEAQNSFQPYSEDAASDAWEIEQLVESGIGRLEASERVRSVAKTRSRFTLGG